MGCVRERGVDSKGHGMKCRYWREAKKAQADALYERAWETLTEEAECDDIVARLEIKRQRGELVDRAVQLEDEAENGQA